MKHFNFLLVAVAILLTVTAVSCTTMAGTQDDYYYNNRNAQVYGNRIYVDDPYRGTVVLERDPRNGRYYESNPYYNGYYGGRIDSRNYGNTYYGRSPYYGRTNSGSYRNNTPNSTPTNSQNTQSQNTQRPSEDAKKTRDDARKRILGN